jgi:hypothetical protein
VNAVLYVIFLSAIRTVLRWTERMQISYSSPELRVILREWMTALLRRTTITVSVIGALTVVTLVMGQSAARYRGIVPVDGCTAPCLLGIRTGELTPDQALDMLRAQFPVRQFRVEQRSYTVFSLSAAANARNVPGVTMDRLDAFDVQPMEHLGGRLEITVTSAQDSVTAIAVDGRHAPDLMPTVGDVVRAYGTPACLLPSPISPTSSPALLYAAKAGHSLLVVSVRGNFRYTDPVLELLAFTNPRQYPNCQATQARRWR